MRRPGGQSEVVMEKSIDASEKHGGVGEGGREAER